MVTAENKGTPYVTIEPIPVAFPIFSTEQLTDARSRGIKVNDFGGTLILQPTSPEVAKIQQICKDVAKAEWPGRPLSELRFPLSAGDKKVKEGKNDWAAGKILLKVKAPSETKDGKPKRAPNVHHANNINAIVNEPQLSQLLYSGSIVAANLTFKATKGNGSNIKDGVTCYVNSLLIVRDGERMAGRSAAETFKGVVGHVSNESPLTGAMATADEDIL